MRFGLFGSAQARRGLDVDSGAGFREFIDYNVEAEQLGYHSSFLVEHHFTGFGQVSATLNLLTWVGARTKHLRLGSAVMVLPWHNPVLLAEQAATIDLLSDGRLDFGIGKGYRHNEFVGFCVSMEEADDRFEEALSIIMKAWTTDTRWSFRGKYWSFEDVIVEPPTAQKPYPPLWMGAGSPESLTRAAKRGHNVLLDQFAPVQQVGERVAIYRAAVEAEGKKFDPMSVAVTRSMNVVTTEAERRKAIETRLMIQKRIDRLAQTPEGNNKASIISYAHTLEAAGTSALYGTPDEIAAKLQALRGVGVEYVLLNSAGGLQSLRRFAREVMPQLESETRPGCHRSG
jgi:alkanesulfonate monooxygenase SsuD/methylene tetrahydromethanopterin reductase-like flavin-dependent oxidoreductase (luciferase family)